MSKLFFPLLIFSILFNLGCEDEEPSFSILGGIWIESQYTVDGDNWTSYAPGTSGDLLSYQFGSNGNYIVSGGDNTGTLSRYYQYCESENVF